MATLPPLADVNDLSIWIGESISTASEIDRANLALRFASALVRKEARRTWVDEAGDLEAVPDDVQLVTLASAARGFTNPDGIIDESLDDWRGRRLDEAAGFALTEAEKALLADYRGASRGGIGTIATTRGDIGAPDDLRWIINGPDPTNPWWE